MFIFQNGDLRWVDGNPLTYAEWFDPKRNSVYPNKPGNTTDKQIPKFLRGTIISSTLKQPISDPGTQCTVMFPYVSTGWGNWAKVPCHYIVRNARFICTMPAIPDDYHVAKSKDNIDTMNDSGDWMCPNKWTYVNGTCLRLLSSIKDVHTQHSFSLLKKMCRFVDGKVALLDLDRSAIIHIMKYQWKQSYKYGNVIFQDGTTSARLCRYFVFSEHDTVKLSNPLDCEEVVGRNILCETARISKKILECPKGFYQCEDGACLSTARVCNGVDDCSNAGDEQNCTCGENMYTCADGSCISLSLYCDFRFDCPDKSDESRCVYPGCNKNQFRCNNGQCVSRKNRCDHLSHCLDGSDEHNCDMETNCKGFRCYSGQCLPATQEWDGLTDCDGFFAEDEAGINPLDIERGNYTEQLHVNGVPIPEFRVRYDLSAYCEKPDEVKCDFSHPHCFERHLACIYDESVYGKQPCRRFEHLKHCKDFECPGFFKCPNSYCIPQRKVCDGVWDCFDGFEERDCEIRSCSGLLKCIPENICIAKEEVCDGIVNCLSSHEDERMCNIPCPNQCQCDGLVVNCASVNITKIPNMPIQTRGITLSLNSILYVSFEFERMFFLSTLNMSHNNVRNIVPQAFKDLSNLLVLDLSFNKIIHLYENIFRYLNKLQEIRLYGNPVASIDPFAFNGLSSVRFLDLSDTVDIQILKGNTFTGLHRLESLDISSNRLLTISDEAFSGLSECNVIDMRDTAISKVEKGALANLTVHNLYSDKVKYCCMAPHVRRCLPEPDEFSSCDDLMSNTFLRMSIWVLGMFATLGNAFVFSWRLIKERVTPASILVVNLALSDFFMGVYLVIIGSFDVIYRGEYIIYAEQWKSSVFCAVAGFLSTTSSEMSVYLLLLITFDRVRALMFPFSKLRLTTSRSCAVVAVGWVMSLTLALIPAVATSAFGHHFYGQNSVCLPFTLRHTKVKGWEYSLVIFVVLNLAAFISIFIGYTCIYRTVILSRKSAGVVARDDVRLARRITLIVMTDFLCWVPIILLSIIATSGVPIPGSVSAWVAVIVLPLNSALNPVLYTLTGINCRSSKKQANHANSVSKVQSTGDTKL